MCWVMITVMSFSSLFCLRGVHYFSVTRQKKKKIIRRSFLHVIRDPVFLYVLSLKLRGLASVIKICSHHIPIRPFSSSR